VRLSDRPDSRFSTNDLISRSACIPLASRMSDSTEKTIPLNVRLAADGGAACLNPKTVADTILLTQLWCNKRGKVNESLLGMI
jgi:hypothetical protein